MASRRIHFMYACRAERAAPATRVACAGKDRTGPPVAPSAALMVTPTLLTTAPPVRAQDETPSGYPPRYQVIGEPNGFRVEGRERCPVFVRLSPGKTTLLITSEAGTLDTYDEEAGYFHSGTGYICGLFGYYRLLETLAALAMRNWNRPDTAPNEWSGVYQWALGRTKRALHFRGVYSEWQRLLALVPDQKRSLARAVFAATFEAGRPGCETWPELLAHPYLVQDILRYRAAASACHYAEELIGTLGDLLIRSRRRGASPQGIGERCIAYRERDQQSRELLWNHTDDYFREQRALRTEALAILSQDWKGLYASQGKAGRSLCRTLMNLPGGISGSMLRSFPIVEPLLTSPITDRLVLLTLLLFGKTVTDPTLLPAYWEGAIFARVSRQETLSALRRLATHQEHPLRPYRAGVAELVWFIADYCRTCRLEGTLPHTGKLPSLTEKAIVWHRQWQAEAEVRMQLAAEEAERLEQERLADPTPTAFPPIPLPKSPGVRFLGSVGAVYQEGKNMGHCIGGLATEARDGAYYLFHVEYDGQRASVQVSRQGEVIQSKGPHNADNTAAEFGKQVLSRWGSALRRRGRASSPRPDAGGSLFDAPLAENASATAWPF